MREVINTLIMDGNKILLFRKKKVWILPGGKPIEGESHLETLSREFKEEASEAEIEVGEFYESFRGISPCKRDVVESQVYYAQLKNPSAILVPSNEIREIKFFKPYDALSINLSEITYSLIKRLIEKRIILQNAVIYR